MDLQVQSFSPSVINYLTVPPAKQGLFDEIAQNNAAGNDPTPIDKSTYNTAAKIMASYDLNNISPNQMADLGTALHEAGAISFADYTRFVTKPLTGDPEQTSKLRDQPIDAIQQMQNVIDWQVKQTNPIYKVGLPENKLLLNVMENLNSLSTKNNSSA